MEHPEVRAVVVKEKLTSTKLSGFQLVIRVGTVIAVVVVFDRGLRAANGIDNLNVFVAVPRRCWALRLIQWLYDGDGNSRFSNQICLVDDTKCNNVGSHGESVGGEVGSSGKLTVDR